MTLEPIPVERRSTRSTNSTASSPPNVTAVSITAEQQRAVALATSVVTVETLGGSLRVPGIVEAPESGRAQARVRAAGFVERVDVRQTGVRVAQGQTLAWIYSPEIYRAQEELLAATRWTATQSSADLIRAARRSLELFGLTPSDIDTIVQTGQPLRATPIRSPRAGFVTRFNALLGSRADLDTILYEIADLSTVWVIASVHERDLNHITVGMTARFSVSGQTETKHEAHVDLIEPQVDEATRTARVRLSLHNRDFALRPGQYGDVQLEGPGVAGIFVPRDAVIDTGAHQYVYVAVGADRFEPRSVRRGATVESRVQVIEGLTAGDRIVTRGSFMLDSESRLQASLAAGSR
jgi:Cu(I)/Ag(I) efflux system membrane fusion protein